MVLLISVDLQQNLANGNERIFLSAIGFCVHTATEHKCRKGGQQRRVGMEAKQERSAERVGMKAKLLYHTL